VRAPIEGVIQTRTVETGQYVSPGYVMATLLRQDPMLLRFEVEPQDAPRLKPGMEAKFTMRETQRAFSAKITLVAGAADPATHTVGVTGEVVSDGHKYWLRPGSFCDVTVDVGATRDAPVIPRIATRATDHGYIVWVANGDVAEERVSKLGISSKDGWVEVRSGLAAGDVIVVHGGEALTTGARVRASRVTSLDASAPEAPPPDASADGHARARRRDGGEGAGGGRE
jgi:multidrug efflux system membrane fusion protein